MVHVILGSAIQVMLSLKRAAKTADYPGCCRLALARQHYSDTTTALSAETKVVATGKGAIMMGQETQPREALGAASAGSVPSRWSPDEVLFRKEGEYWTVGYGGSVFRLKDTKGLAYLSGQGALRMLCGGAGVGKTRLALEMAQEAARQGFRLFIGRCYDREDPYPYLPFAEMIEVALAQVPSLEECRQALGDNAAELAQLVPRLRRVFPDIPAPLALPPRQARRYLFQSLVAVLARAARRVPLFLILDDLQWAGVYTLPHGRAPPPFPSFPRILSILRFCAQADDEDQFLSAL